VVTEDGIAEQGAHAELVKAGGLYQTLHEAQVPRDVITLGSVE
jgi:ATP-binding cassette subfamily B protein